MRSTEPLTLCSLHALVRLLEDPPALYRVARCTLTRDELRRLDGMMAHLEAIAARGVKGSPFYDTADAKLAALRDLKARGVVHHD